MKIAVFIHNGPCKGRSIKIDKESASIGRGNDNDVPIDDPSVSKRHARIFKTAKGFSIQDLNSQNGTWIDGTLIASGKKIRIESGTPISIGNILVSAGKALPPSFLSVQSCIDLARSVTEGDEKVILDDTLMTYRRKLQQVFEISTLLSQSRDIKKVYCKILDSLFLYFKKLEVGVILLRNKTSGALTPVASKVRDKRITSRIQVSHSIVGQAIDQSKAIMVTGRSDDSDLNLPIGAEDNRFVSAICVPLITKTALQGVIYVYSTTAPQAFTKEDLLFIASISGPAAVVIENAELHDDAKKSKKKLRRASDELEARVQKRTSALMEANAKLRELSLKDHLTGLFNRRQLERALEAEFIRATGSKRSFSTLLLDIDCFKTINDCYGHSCGDAMLAKVALLIRGCLRNSDVVARYGGDEIAILLPETDKSNATKIAEKLRRLIAETPFNWNATTLNITCSIGIATMPDDPIASWGDMLVKADEALYRGKEIGKIVVVALERSDRQNSFARH